MTSPSDWFKRARGDSAIFAAEQRLQERLDAQASEIAALRSDVARLSDGLGGVAMRTDISSWERLAQPGELEFHKRPGIRSEADWEQGNATFWRRHGFESQGWQGKTIVDVGAGSRLRILYFEGAELIAIEPLAQQFVEEVEWEDISKADEIFPDPAEQDIPELHGRADLVVSVNVLDHCFDFEQCVLNIRHYLKPDGLAWLSFDQHAKPDKMHPLVLNDRVARAVFHNVGLDVEQATEGGNYHKGLGASALHYWLRPK